MLRYAVAMLRNPRQRELEAGRTELRQVQRQNAIDVYPTHSGSPILLPRSDSSRRKCTCTVQAQSAVERVLFRDVDIGLHPCRIYRRSTRQPLQEIGLQEVYLSWNAERILSPAVD